MLHSCFGFSSLLPHYYRPLNPGLTRSTPACESMWTLVVCVSFLSPPLCKKHDELDSVRENRLMEDAMAITLKGQGEDGTSGRSRLYRFPLKTSSVRPSNRETKMLLCCLDRRFNLAVQMPPSWYLYYTVQYTGAGNDGIGRCLTISPSRIQPVNRRSLYKWEWEKEDSDSDKESS